VIVQGKISGKSRSGVSAYVNVNNPSLLTTTTFKDALEQIGIAVKGIPVLGKMHKKSWRIALYCSEPLSHIIEESNKTSNNFVAEQLLKTLGAEVIGPPGTTDKGLQVVREFFTELGISPDAYVLENGSGLSRNNRLSPEQIVMLLTYMYDNFEVRSEFLASLAVAGVDGTLQRRLRDTQAERRLRAKTGAIQGVSCLSGYAVSKNNEVFVFSIMMNDYKSGGYAVKQIQNKIGLLLTEFYRQTYDVRSKVDHFTN
jgi:D-alanyl-D-alanine carboxypeptidase/D-alanyl-D-alanine-endopeptidase (penicillin-binding protein 4)